MSLEPKSIHVRLCPEAHAILATEAQLRDRDLVEIARDVIEQWALGRGHSHTVLARQIERAGLSGTKRNTN